MHLLVHRRDPKKVPEDSRRCQLPPHTWDHSIGKQRKLTEIVRGVTATMDNHTDGNIEYLPESLCQSISMSSATDFTPSHSQKKDEHHFYIGYYLLSHLLQNTKHLPHPISIITDYTHTKPNNATIPHRLRPHYPSRLQTIHTKPSHVHHTILPSFQ